MYRFDDREYHRLAEVLDVPTFRRVPGTSNYWMDKRSVYTDPCLSLPGQQYFFGNLTYADLCLFGTFKWIMAVSKEPLFFTTEFRAWWDRMEHLLGI